MKFAYYDVFFRSFSLFTLKATSIAQKECITWRSLCPLAWLLAFTKSFAWLISRVVALFYTPQLRDRRATRTISLMLKAM